MDNSYAAGGKGQSISIGNTQTNALAWLSITTGTSTASNRGIEIDSDSWISGWLTINSYGTSTQSTRAEQHWIRIGNNWNTNSSNDSFRIGISNSQNTGTWINTGVYINNTSSDFTAWANSSGAWMNIYQAGSWVGISIYWAPTISSTNWLINSTLDDTQSNATVMQKIDLWTSAQAHNGIKIVGSNGSSTAVAFNADMNTWYTGKLFRGALNSVEKFVVNADGSIVTTPLISAAVWYLNIPQNPQSAAYTTVANDAGKHIYHPSADTTDRTWTIDSNANVAYPVGTAISFVNDTSGGVITIAITTDTLVLAGAWTTGSRTLAANGVATAIKITSTRWMISWTWLT
jgi:hypothetical protein